MIRTIILMLTMCFMLWVGSAAAGSYPPGSVFIEVQVKASDTLWTIAGRYCPEDVDIRDYITTIKAVNKLAANDFLYPGQVIKIPKD